MHVFVVLVSCASAFMAMAVKKNQILCIYDYFNTLVECF